MKTDLRVVLPNRPGALGLCLNAIADAGLTVEGICGDLRPGEGWGFLHILLDDGEGGRKALEGAGFEVTGVHEVAVHEIAEGAGSLAELVDSYSGKGDNIEIIYASSDKRWVIGTEGMLADRPGVRMGDTTN